MYYQIKAWFLGVIAAALIFLIAGCCFLVFQNQTAKADLLQERSKKESAVKELEEYTLNTESSVKNGASLFLKAFLEMDPEQKEPTAARIKPYTTEKARSQVIPPGTEKRVSDFKISARIAAMKLYYTPIDSDKASILAKVTREINVNGTATKTPQMLELQLILKNNKWIVDDIQLISQ